LNNPFESIDPGDLAQNWRDKAACLGTFTELFYYVNGSGRVHTEVAAALDICGTCTVTQECLQLAIDSNDHHAVMGGTTPAQRQHLMRKEIA